VLKDPEMADNYSQSPTKTPEQDKIKTTPAVTQPMQQSGKAVPLATPEKA
jgi:hypothetical protein